MTDALSAKFASKELEEKYGITYDLFVKKPAELSECINQLNYQTYNAILIGGGDGTVRTAAQVMVDKEVPLAILPLGTFNYFAKELGHPDDIDALFAIIKNNKTKQVDLGQLNEYIFLNHSWIGFYSYILKLKEKHKKILGKNKIFKIIFTSLNFFKFFPIYDIEITTEGQVSHYKTCLVYISNNDNYTNIMDLGMRKSLTSGLFSVSILNCKSRWQLFMCMLHILFNRFKETQYITNFLTDSMVISAKSKLITVVIDGELFKLATPLIYSMHKKKLTVISP